MKFRIVGGNTKKRQSLYFYERIGRPDNARKAHALQKNVDSLWTNERLTYLAGLAPCTDNNNLPGWRN